MTTLCTINSRSHFDSFKGVIFLTPGRPFKRVTLTSFGLTPVKSHFNPLNRVTLTVHVWSHFIMTLERVRMHINFSEVSFYTDLESFRLLFGIEVSF